MCFPPLKREALEPPAASVVVSWFRFFFYYRRDTVDLLAERTTRKVRQGFRLPGYPLVFYRYSRAVSVD
jgi:hypothetical protein